MPNSKKTVRQYAIAQQLGLSASTVSKVLANRRDVSEKTRSRVIEAAQKLGYIKPNRARQSSATGLSSAPPMIGMLVRLGPEAPADYRPDYLSGVSDAASDLDVSLVVHCIRNLVGEEEFFQDPKLQPTAMRTNHLAGLLLAGDWTEKGMLLSAQQLPTVAITFGTHQGVIDSVEPDTLSAMRMILEHLKSRGHRRLAFAGLCPEEYWTVDRYAGCVSASASHGMEIPGEAVLTLAPGLLRDQRLDGHWAEHAEKLLVLVRELGVTAIVCCSDWAAFHIYRELTRLGVRIPEEVSLTGFDNHEVYSLGCPPVTSTHIPRTQLAELAFRRVVARYANPDLPVRRALYGCQLVDHGTTAPPLGVGVAQTAR